MRLRPLRRSDSIRLNPGPARAALTHAAYLDALTYLEKSWFFCQHKAQDSHVVLMDRLDHSLCGRHGACKPFVFLIVHIYVDTQAVLPLVPMTCHIINCVRKSEAVPSTESLNVRSCTKWLGVLAAAVALQRASLHVSSYHTVGHGTT